MAKVSDCSGRRRRSLPANDIETTSAILPDDCRKLSPRTILMGFYDLQHKPRCNSGVEGVASPLKNPHSG